MVIEPNILDTITRDEGHFEGVTFADITCFDSDSGCATPRLVVGVLQNAIKVTITLKCDTFA